MKDFFKAFSCGFLRPFGGPHYDWCPNRKRRDTFEMFEMPTSFYEQEITRAPKSRAADE